MAGGSSSQAQTSTYTDNRAVLGQGSQYANNGASVTSNAFTTNYVLDNGAVNKALQVTADTASNLGGAAIDMAGRTASGAFNFGSDALGTVDNALSKVDAATAKAFNFGSDAFGTVDNALSKVDATTSKAFNFGSDAIGRALSSNDATTTKAFNFGSDAIGLADSFYTRALDYSTHATDQALSNLQATQQLTAAAYNDAKGRGALTDKLLIGAIAAMAVVAFAAVHK